MLSDRWTKEENQELIQKGGCWIGLLGIVLLPFWTFLYAYVVRTLWGWYVVPLGGPVLTWAGALGLCLLYRYFTYNGDDLASSAILKDHMRENPWREFWRGFFKNLVRAGFALLFGWAYKHFLGGLG